MRRVVPIAVTSLSGLVVLLDFLGGGAVLGRAPDLLIEAAAFLAALALLMGATHLAAVHGRRALQRQPQGGHSAALVIALLATFGVGVLRPGSTALTWIFEHLYTPLQASMSALLAFYTISGAYRALRLRRAGATLMLGTSMFMLLAQTAVSQHISPYIPALGAWVLAIPVTAGMRGILFGVALGIMAASLRILTGIDRPQVSR